VTAVGSETTVAAEEKRRIGQVLKVPRRTRDRDDIVLGVRKGFQPSGDEFKNKSNEGRI